MNCSLDPNIRFFRRMHEKAIDRRVPLSGSIEITHRCNLKCVHCYLGEKPGNAKETHGELSTEQWRRIIDEITDAGCLFLVITGGEPLLRKDFSDIFIHARRRGLITTIFTNGTLIDDNTIRLFETYTPRVLEISLYGATQATYESITGLPGSYDRCMKGIDRLAREGIPFRLKTVLMTLNASELSEMERMADSYGVTFRFDPAICPTFQGKTGPMAFRVPARKAVEMEFADPDRHRKWVEYFREKQYTSPSDHLYGCGTGLASFHIDPGGRLYPCLMVRNPGYNLLSGSFSEGWMSVIPKVRERKNETNVLCKTCRKQHLCGYCPAFFQLETGDEQVPSSYICDLGRFRYEAIMTYSG